MAEFTSRQVPQNTDGYGVKAPQFSDVTGYEKWSAEFVADIYSRTHTQMGIQSNDPNILAGFEPYHGGHLIFKVLSWPPFWNEKMIRLGQILLEDQLRGLDGITNGQLQTIERESGAVKRASTYVANYKENNGKFTLKFPEFRGMPGRKLADYWLHGMSDPMTGATHFYGKQLQPNQMNKGMTAIAIITGPTRRPDDIEFACLWVGAAPTSELLDLLGSVNIGEEGDGGEYSWEMGSVGFDRKSPELYALAKKIVYGVNYFGQSFLDGAVPYELYKNYLSADVSLQNLRSDISAQGNHTRFVAESSPEKGTFYSENEAARMNIRTAIGIEETANEVGMRSDSIGDADKDGVKWGAPIDDGSH